MSGQTPRTRVCLTCRTLFDGDESCRGKGHRTVRIAENRAALAEEVWGADSRARQLRQAAKAGAGAGTLGGVLDVCGTGVSPFDACDTVGGGGEAIFGVILTVIAMAVAAVVGVILFWAVRAFVRFIREKLQRPVATGALTAAPKPRKKPVVGNGVVKGGKLLDTPWREGSAYAYAMELHENRVLGGGAMMRDARTGGFEVAMDDGRIVRVPEGRIRVLSPVAKVTAESSKVAQFVESIDRARSDEETVFPFHYVKAVTVEEGDRVELLGELELAQEAQSAGYRESANVMQLVGTPYLRVTKLTGVRVEVPPLEAAGRAEAIADEEESPASVSQRSE